MPRVIQTVGHASVSVGARDPLTPRESRVAWRLNVELGGRRLRPETAEEDTLRASIAFAVAVLAMAVTLSATGVPSAAGTTYANWEYWQLDRDGCWDAATMDANFNGTAEDVWFDMDNDCRWDTRLWNSRGGENLLERATFDMNENGVPEYLMLDINQRVGFEWLYIDRNQDRMWDMRRIIPGSDLDVVTRSNTYNANSTILHQFRMRTGQSLLYPSFPTP
jgi:hypothetical protein